MVHVTVNVHNVCVNVNVNVDVNVNVNVILHVNVNDKDITKSEHYVTLRHMTNSSLSSDLTYRAAPSIVPMVHFKDGATI